MSAPPVGVPASPSSHYFSQDKNICSSNDNEEDI